MDGPVTDMKMFEMLSLPSHPPKPSEGKVADQNQWVRFGMGWHNIGRCLAVILYAKHSLKSLRLKFLLTVCTRIG